MEYRLEKLTSDMLADSRICKQKSQQYMAKELGKITFDNPKLGSWHDCAKNDRHAPMV